MINKNLIDFQEILDKILKYKDIDVNEKDDSIIFVSTILLLFFTKDKAKSPFVHVGDVS